MTKAQWRSEDLGDEMLGNNTRPEPDYRVLDGMDLDIIEELVGDHDSIAVIAHPLSNGAQQMIMWPMTLRRGPKQK
mgnify:CR=1 FL=1